MSRAMWKGTIALGKERVGIKMYSAVEERGIHFHMLHKKDQAPVEQRIVRKDTGEVVLPQDIRKAFSISSDSAVILNPEDLARLTPTESRDIHLFRFVSPQALDGQWYDRPYYLGPDGNADSYFALTQALAARKWIGIAGWVMRKKRYLGALMAVDGYLMITTIRRAEQIIRFSRVEPAASARPLPNELKLAEQLVASITQDFEPESWHNEYRQRLLKAVDAKTRGVKVMPVRVAKKVRSASLGASLIASIAAVKEKRVA